MTPELAEQVQYPQVIVAPHSRVPEVDTELPEKKQQLFLALPYTTTRRVALQGRCRSEIQPRARLWPLGPARRTALPTGKHPRRRRVKLLSCREPAVTVRPTTAPLTTQLQHLSFVVSEVLVREPLRWKLPLVPPWRLLLERETHRTLQRRLELQPVGQPSKQ